MYIFEVKLFKYNFICKNKLLSENFSIKGICYFHLGGGGECVSAKKGEEGVFYDETNIFL